VSIATAYFTRMSAHARDGQLAAVREDLSASLRTIILLIAGAAVALGAAAIPFAAFFSHSSRETLGISGVLLAYLLGLVPFSTTFLLQRTFYALNDTRTPFFVQLVQSTLFVIGAITVLTLPPSAIGAGIALVTSLAGTVQAVVMLALVRRRLGGVDGRLLLRRFGLYALATLPAALVGIVLLWALGGLAPIGLPTTGFALANKATNLVSVVAIGAAALAAYVGVLTVARIPELRELTEPLRRRLTRP
jgi:putative peptidoglycan lipid II flippase